MSWEITIPFRDRSASVVEILDAAREVLEGEERAITHEVAIAALGRGVTRVGDLLDELEAAGPAGRRQLLDRARENAGLPATAKVDAVKEAEAATRLSWSGPMRDGSGRVQALCSEPSCSACLPGELAGSFQWVSAKRWWVRGAPRGHEDDLEPYRSRLVLGPRGIIDLDAEAAERERQRVAAESRRHQREAREAQRREDAARLAEFEAASNEQFRRESVVHRP